MAKKPTQQSAARRRPLQVPENICESLWDIARARKKPTTWAQVALEILQRAAARHKKTRQKRS